MSDATAEDEIDRQDVHDWNNPHREINHLRWYNPLLWIFVAVDILLMIRWRCWHKRQSKKASRQNIATNLTFALQSCDLALKDDDISHQEEQYIKDTRRHIERVVDEMNLQSDHLDQYLEDKDE